MEYLGTKASNESLATQADAQESSEKDIFEGLASATGNNIHGAKNSEASISWDSSTNDSEHIDAHVDGDSELIAKKAEKWSVDASIAAIDNGVNNRTTYIVIIEHQDSLGETIYEYIGSQFYIRDDANAYDSGAGFRYAEMNVAVGDKVIIKSRVLDVQTTTGTVDASTVLTKLLIRAK